MISFCNVIPIDPLGLVEMYLPPTIDPICFTEMSSNLIFEVLEILFVTLYLRVTGKV